MKHRTWSFFKSVCCAVLVLMTALLLLPGTEAEAATVVSGTVTEYDLDDLEFSSDTIYAGNEVNVSWCLPYSISLSSFDELKLYRVDLEGKIVECGEIDFCDPMGDTERVGSMYVAFGPEETGEFMFYISGESWNYGLCEFVSDNVLRVLPHDPAEAHVVWKNAEGHEITSAVVGQQVTADWTISNVNFTGSVGRVSVRSTNGEVYEQFTGTSGTVTYTLTAPGACRLNIWGCDNDNYSFDVYTSETLTVISPVTADFDMDPMDGKDRVTAEITGLGGGSGREAVSASWLISYSRWTYGYTTSIPVESEIVESWNEGSAQSVTYVRDFTWGDSAKLTVQYLENEEYCTASFDSVTLSGHAIPDIQASYTNYSDGFDVSGGDYFSMDWQVTGADRITEMSWNITTAGQYGIDPYDVDADTGFYSIDLNVESLEPNEDGSFSGTEWVRLPETAIQVYLAISAEKDDFEESTNSYDIETTGAVYPVEDVSVEIGDAQTPGGYLVVWNVNILNQGVHFENMECSLRGQDDETIYTGIYYSDEYNCYFNDVADGTYYLHISGKDKLGRSFSATSTSPVTVSYGELVPEARFVTTIRGDHTVNLQDNIVLAYVKNDGPEGSTSGMFYYVTPEGDIEIPGTERDMEEVGAPEITVYGVEWNIEDIAAGDYEVHFVLTYGEGQTTECSGTVTVVRNIPQKIENLIAEDNLDCVWLNWPMAAEIDTAAYGIYRREEGEESFEQIGVVLGRDNCVFEDVTVSRNTTYEYYVAAITEVGEKSEPGNIVQVTYIGDSEAPVVAEILLENQYANEHSVVYGSMGFLLQAQDNLAVTESALSWTMDGETWTEFGRASDGNLGCTLDTTGLPDGQIEIRGIAWDAAGNESVPVTRTFRIDNTGPEKVTGLECTSAQRTALTLKWNQVADYDIANFIVQRKATDGSWQYETTASGTLGANISGLEPGTEYTFRVVGVDLWGNTGTYSDELTAATVTDTTAPVVTGIVPQGGAYADRISVSATVQDDCNVASVTFRMKEGADGEWLDIHTESFAGAGVSASRTVSYTLELEDLAEGVVYIRVTAADDTGNVSEDTETAPQAEYTVDRTAPAAPAGVSARGRAEAVEISWEQGAEADLGTYSVYRAETEDGEYTQIASGLASLNHFDYTAEQGVTYAYRVRVCDRAGNLSDFSETVWGMITPDEEPPVIVNIYPEGGDTISPANCTLQVLATDNTELDAILVEYSTDGRTTFKRAAMETGIGGKGKWLSCGFPEDDEWIDGGVIDIRAVAMDACGNESLPFMCAYHIDTTAPEVDTVSITYLEEAGSVQLAWEGMGEPDLAGYRIYRMNSDDGNFVLIGSRAADAEYRITDSSPVYISGEYIYRIEALDTRGNASETTVTFEGAVEIIREAGPEAYLSCEPAMEAGVEYLFDASASTGEITAWHFDFGDGSVSEGQTAVHFYAETGEYAVTLTVTDANGKEDSISRNVTVTERTMLGTLSVLVVDENGAGVPGASVYLDLGDENQAVKAADENGRVSFTAMAGGHVIGAIIPDNHWLPAQTRAVVTSGQTTEITMTLVHQDLMEGSFEARQMTFEEIVEAGIDVTDPDNRNYVQIDVHLVYRAQDYTESITFNYYDPDPAPVVIDIGPTIHDDDDDDHRQLIIKPIPGTDKRNHPGGGSGGSNYQFSGEDISLAVLDIPIGISALKDFFDVKLYIINNASAEFSMLDNIFSLNIPTGLSLMQTYRSEKSAEVHRAEIKGQTTETIQWILRGDTVGEYYLSADYSGILSKFNTEISTRFEAASPVQVTGLSDAHVTIEIADQLDKDRLYYNVLLENEGEKDLYCPDIESQDELIRMDLFDAASAERAKAIRYDAKSLDELSISVAPTIDPNVFEPGALLIKHFVTYDEVQYTEKKLALEEYWYTLSDDYGIEVTLEVLPLSRFTDYLGIGISPTSLDQTDLAWLKDNENFAYWILYKGDPTDPDLHLKSKVGEFFWDLVTLLSGGGGSVKELFDLDHVESIEALIASAMGISVENAEGVGAAVTAMEWLKSFKNAVNLLHPEQKLLEAFLKAYPGYSGIEEKLARVNAVTWVNETITLIEQQYLGNLLEYINNGEGDLASFFGTYSEYTNYYQENIAPVAEFTADEDVRKYLFGGLFTDEKFDTVWKGIGYTMDAADAIVTATRDIGFDVSVAIAAQKNLKACNLFLDALIDSAGDSPEQNKVRDAARRVKRVIQENDPVSSILENNLKQAVLLGIEWTADMGVDALSEAASSTVILEVVRVGLKITTYIGNEYFHVSDTHDLADNIVFVSVMSDDIRQALNRGGYSDEDTVQLIGYLLELRRMGESQVAQYGMSQEVIRCLYDSEDLFLAVRRITVPESEHSRVNSWQKWRDYVEDEISALMVKLLRKPVYPYGVNLRAPIVTIDYANFETAQRFGEDYIWRTGSETEWTPCTGDPIPAAPGTEPYVLMVRNARADAGEERLTAAVLIGLPPDLSENGIEITCTEGGYRLEFPDNDLTYSYTMSSEPIAYDYMDELEEQIPEGSYSWDLAAGPESGYLYLRSAATPEQFASEIWEISLDQVKMKAFVFSDPVNGTVELIGYNGFETDLVIPDAIPQEDGSVWKVTGIGAEALKDHTALKTVWIPEGVAYIGDSAFEGCSALRFAAIPGSTSVIGNEAFRDCAKLSWASLPAGTATVGNDAFAACAPGFTAIAVPGSPAETALRAAGVSCKAPAALPAGLTEIEESAFEGTVFAAVTIPADCMSVGSFAFADCRNLHAVYLETGTAEIAPDAFPDQDIVFYAPAGSAAYGQLAGYGYHVYSRN